MKVRHADIWDMLVMMNTTDPMPRRRAGGEPPEETIPVTIRFPISMRERGEVIAKKDVRSFTQLVVYAVQRYLSEREADEASK